MKEKNKFVAEIIVSVILIVLLLLLWKPTDSEMPNEMLMAIVLGLIIIFSVFASFIFRENARDERESLHRLMAGRFAYLVGAGILLFRNNSPKP